MTVYVDQLMRTIPNKKWPYTQSCHMFADSEEELHVFAKVIGMRRDWFQDHALLKHYDLTAKRRVVAIRKGAVSVSMAFLSNFIKENNRRMHNRKTFFATKR